MTDLQRAMIISFIQESLEEPLFEPEDVAIILEATEEGLDELGETDEELKESFKIMAYKMFDEIIENREE